MSMQIKLNEWDQFCMVIVTNVQVVGISLKKRTGVALQSIVVNGCGFH